MIRTLSRKYSRDLYIPWLQDLIDTGSPVGVRGRTTQEFLNCVSEVTEPWHHCILVPSRRWNPWLALSEALWILAGRDDVAAIQPYNQHIVDYSDDGRTLYGAYGKRMYDQIDDVIERLQRDPSDRRAVIQIWDSTTERNGYYKDSDLTTSSKDPPCNDMVMFKLRHNKLHMSVINRSNDIHYGLFAVNLPTFGIFQSYMAARLGVDMGTQTHFSNSLHVYTDDSRAVEITDRMLYREPEDMPRYPEHEKVFTDLTWIKNHEQFAEMCSNILDGSHKLGQRFPLFLTFAAHLLKIYRDKNSDAINYVQSMYPEFQDWTLASRIFAQKVWRNE